MSIAENVTEVTKIIRNECLKRLEQTEVRTSDEINHFFQQTEFDVAVNGQIPNINNLYVKLFCYCINDENEYKRDELRLDIHSYVDFETKTIVLKLVTINGVPSEGFDSTIQHEVNHIFQFANGWRSYNHLYGCAKKILDGENIPLEDQLLAMIIYTQDKGEQDSLVNGYYAYLKQNNIDWESVYYHFPNDKNNPYGLFLTFCSYFNQIQYTDEHIREVLGITKKQFLRVIDKATKRMRNKTMKVAAKYRNNIINPKAQIKTHNV